MVLFTIKAGILQKAFLLSRSKGEKVEKFTTLMKDCLMEVKDGQIFMENMDEANAVLIQITIPDVNIEEEGTIPIEFDHDDVKYATLDKRLMQFKADDTVKIKFENGMINIKRVITKNEKRLSYDIPSIDSKDRKSKMTLETYPFIYDEEYDLWVVNTDNEDAPVADAKISIDVKNLKEVLQDGKDMLYRKYLFIVNEDTALVSITNTDTKEVADRELDCEVLACEEEVQTLITYGLEYIVKNLSGNIIIWIGQQMPLFIKLEDEFEATILIAPSGASEEVEDEDEDVEYSDEELKAVLEENIKEIQAEQDELLDSDETLSGADYNPEEEFVATNTPTLKMNRSDLIRYAKALGINGSFKNINKKKILEKIKEKEKNE